MTKKDEINKNNNIIIIGIAAFAIIAIAIIAAFNFFTPKSQAQVQVKDVEQVAVYKRNKLHNESYKDVDKQASFKNENRDAFKLAHFENGFDKLAHKNKTEPFEKVFKAGDKNTLTFAFAKVKKFEKLPEVKQFVKADNFKDQFSCEKEKTLT